MKPQRTFQDGCSLCFRPEDLIADGEMIANNPEYTTAAALLLKGTENCALYIAPEPERPKVVEPKIEPKEEPVIAEIEEKQVVHRY